MAIDGIFVACPKPFVSALHDLIIISWSIMPQEEKIQTEAEK